MTKTRYLIDANVLIARVFEGHIHHFLASTWLATPGLNWGLCPLSESGYMRYATAPDRGNLSMSEATAVLEKLTQLPGFEFHPSAQDWRTLTKPFFKRLQGYKQVTDAYLLGQAIMENLVLATFDSAILHLAGEYKQHIHLLEPGSMQGQNVHRSEDIGRI